MKAAVRNLLAAAIAVPLACAVMPGAGSPARAEGQGGIVAIANDQAITERDITQRIALRKLVGDLPAGSMTRKEALQNLIDDQVKIAEANRFMQVPSEAEVDDRIKRIAQGQKMSTSEFLAKAKKEGISEDSLRRYFKASMAFNRIIAGRYREDVKVTPAEVDAKMAEINNKVAAEMRRIMNDPGMKPIKVYSLMEITLPIDGEDPMLLQSRALEAQQVVKRFKGCNNPRSSAEGIFNVKFGKKFDADAAKIPKPMKQALDKAGQGRAIGPMRNKAGIQLIALCAVRTIAPQKPDFKMPTREQIERLVINERYDKVEQSYLATAREKVYVEYRNPAYANQ